VLSGRDLCDGLIIRSEEFYRLWRVAVCDQVTSYARRLSPMEGCKIHTHYGLCSARGKKLQEQLRINMLILIKVTRIDVNDGHLLTVSVV
jgi:hypothetical protein